ncbi:MAG: hypothetical protein ACPG4Z_06905 [Chitinophagales bacterium]
MKKVFYIMTLTLLLMACSSAKTYLQNGNYTMAIHEAADKLKKNPKKADKHILALEQAWKIEQIRILDRVKQLKVEGQPESWEEIYRLYSQLDEYQKVVKPVLPLFIEKEFRYADIELIDIDQELADTKTKAAEYLYVKGEQLLATGNKYDARLAFDNFQKVKTYFTDFRDIDAMRDASFNAGQNHILIGYSQHTQMIIPQEFMNNLSEYDETTFNTTWTKYTQDGSSRTEFDYFIEVHINNIDIGPEQLLQNQYTDTKQIQDGTQYVLDENGNVAKDTLGNDVTEPKYIDIHANVYRTEQTKVGTLNGTVEFKRSNGQVFQTFPYQEALVFKNFYATYDGNKNALSAESKKIIGGGFIQFPSDMQMVMDASQIVKTNTYNIVKGNTGLVND